jgi:AAA+ ATPase superfamily predicted ATPase
MVGRKEEQRTLKNIIKKKNAQFVVVYGRRRIGKTFLVRETFGDAFTFSYTGIAGVGMKRQLVEFSKALRAYGGNEGEAPKNWFDAFDALKKLIVRDERERRIVFIDEMPWMDSRKSGFVPALEHFWNGWASDEKNLTLIVCGSAASWITKRVFRNKGGLYNRVTLQIALKPFTLAECKELFDQNGVRMNLFDMIGAYMIFGGIPYYLNMFDARYGLPKNVDLLCFSENAPFRNEYAAVFDSLFAQPDRYAEVTGAISMKKKGLTREELKTKISFADGGNLTRILRELEESGFIHTYRPMGRRKSGALYRLSDPFTAFHLTWMKENGVGNDDAWSEFVGSGAYNAWSGYAFEQVCLAHIPQIKKALGISGVRTLAASWRSEDPDFPGAQVDLVLDRNDNIINLCEMKYTNKEYVIDEKYDLELRNKAGAFSRETKTKKAVHITMVTTYGVRQNKYSSVLQSEVRMENLFE